MRPNTLKQLWNDDKPAFGVWLLSGRSFVAARA